MSANVTRLTAQSAADAVYQQEFSVRYDYPVYFTEHLFGQDNPVFARALTRREPAKRHRFVAFVDANVAATWPALVHEIEERGLIERRPAVDDKRANALHLTRAGRTFLARARAVHDEMEEALIERLGGAKGRDALLALLDRLM